MQELYCSTKLSPSEKAEKKEGIYLDLGAIRSGVRIQQQSDYEDANLDISPREVKIGFNSLIHRGLRWIVKNYKLYFWLSVVDNLKTPHTLNF